MPNDKYPFAALHLEVPYDQVDVNTHPNKSEVRFQNKRLIYEIVTRGLIKVMSTRIGSLTTSNTKITEELKEGSPFDIGKENDELIYSKKIKKLKIRKNFMEEGQIF